MIAFRRVASAIIRSKAQPVAFGFSKDTFKKREEAAEKAYMTQQ
jgi:hypothetical protein